MIVLARAEAAGTVFADYQTEQNDQQMASQLRPRK
jgi:hypothetical protein